MQVKTYKDKPDSFAVINQQTFISRIDSSVVDGNYTIIARLIERKTILRE